MIRTAAALAGAVTVVACTTARSSSTALSPKTCPDSAPAGARCYTLRVPENHAKPAGRTIPLHIVVLPR